MRAVLLPCRHIAASATPLLMLRHIEALPFTPRLRHACCAGYCYTLRYAVSYYAWRRQRHASITGHGINICRHRPGGSIQHTTSTGHADNEGALAGGNESFSNINDRHTTLPRVIDAMPRAMIATIVMASITLRHGALYCYVAARYCRELPMPATPLLRYADAAIR